MYPINNIDFLKCNNTKFRRITEYGFANNYKIASFESAGNQSTMVIQYRSVSSPKCRDLELRLTQKSQNGVAQQSIAN